MKKSYWRITVAVVTLLLILMIGASCASAEQTIHRPATTYAEVEAIVRNYLSIVNIEGQNAYWNAYHSHGGNDTSRLCREVDAGDYTSCITHSACPGGPNGHTKGGCYSNAFAGPTMNPGRQCAGFADYMWYVIFKSTATQPKTYSVSSDYQFRPGDLVRYFTGSYDSEGNPINHSIVVYSSDSQNATIVEANFGGKCLIRGNRTLSQATLRDYVNGSHGWMVKSLVNSDPEPDPHPYADLGADFCGLILNTQHWKPIAENSSTEKITLETEYGVPTQRWRFIRQSDGSYVIRSCNDGKALEMTDGIRSGGTQLSAHTYWEGAYQKWYIIPQGNGYIIQSQHYTDENWVMELNGSYSSDGTPILINTRNDSAAQIWSIYATDEVALKANALSVSVDGAAATFNWNSSYGAQWYGLQIWTNPECTNLYHNEIGTSSGYSIRLPKGTYYAQYGVYDYFNWAVSGIVQFTVNIDCADLGADFCGVILNTQHWKPIAENASTEKITLETEYGVPTQRWRFIRQNDGSYVIRSCNDGKALEMTDGIRTGGTQMTAHEFWDGYYQRWYIVPYNGGYIIQSKHYTDENWVMELSGGSSSDGTAVVINQRNNSSAQIWSIYAAEDVHLKANPLRVSVSKSVATFKWDHSYGVKWYGLYIYTNPECTNLYHNELGTYSGFSLSLPKGTYYANYGVYDHFNWAISTTVQFSVTDDGINSIIGDDKNTIRVGEEITFWYSGLSECSQVRLNFMQNGEVYFSPDSTNSTTYSTYFEEPGRFQVYVSGLFNGVWFNSSPVTVDVLNPVITDNKNVVRAGEEITFTYSGLTECSEVEFRFFDRSDINYYSPNSTQSNSMTTYFERPGLYYVSVRGYLNGNWCESDKLTVYVLNPQISISSDTLNVGVNQTFSYTGLQEADSISFIIYNYAGQIVESHDSTYANAYTVSFDTPGVYSAIVTGTKLDVILNSSRIFFTVADSESTLPTSLMEIGEEAFARDLKLQVLDASGNSELSSICAGAFKQCTNLVKVVIPKTVTYIAADAFDGCDMLTIVCKLNSYAQTYAAENNIPCICLSEEEWQRRYEGA